MPSALQTKQFDVFSGGAHWEDGGSKPLLTGVFLCQIIFWSSSPHMAPNTNWQKVKVTGQMRRRTFDKEE